jgi:hypothetical protein
MPGLLEWHLGEGFGVQVWAEPERAGCSSIVLDESNLEAFVARLREVGIPNDGPEDATSSRILSLVDLDGNRIVVTDSPG